MVIEFILRYFGYVKHYRNYTLSETSNIERIIKLIDITAVLAARQESLMYKKEVTYIEDIGRVLGGDAVIKIDFKGTII